MTPDGDTVVADPRPPGLRRYHDGGRSPHRGQAERLKAALREMYAKMGHSIHYGPGDVHLYGEGSVGAQWTDEQADAVINPGARVFNLSASQISIGIKAATRTAGTL